MIAIDLAWPEIYQAGQAAILRMVKNMQHRNKERYGATENLLERDFLGCLGEIALAKWTDKFWAASSRDYQGRDVAGRWQVRAASRMTDCLILHPDDGDREPFVLALAPRHTLPRVFLRGWIMGAEGKQQQFWTGKTGRPAFFVPQNVLRDMGALLECEREHA